jgi:hypothetical protein
LPIGIVDWPPNRPKSGPDFNTIPLEAPVLPFRGFFVTAGHVVKLGTGRTRPVPEQDPRLRAPRTEA